MWSFYNHATVALQQSHPRTWMEDQRMLHWFISNEFNLGKVLVAPITPAVEITVPMIDPLNAIPNQTNILDQIAELTGETSEEIVIHIESDQEYVERVAEIEGEPEPDVVEYTDPAGNIFEAPVVIDDFITDEEEDAIMEQMLVPVAPERVKFSVDNTETTTEFDFDLNFEDDEEGDSNQFFL